MLLRAIYLIYLLIWPSFEIGGHIELVQCTPMKSEGILYRTALFVRDESTHEIAVFYCLLSAFYDNILN